MPTEKILDLLDQEGTAATRAREAMNIVVILGADWNHRHA